MEWIEDGWAGLRIGMRGNFGDYRDDAIFGRGGNCGVTTDGRLFIADLSNSTATLATVHQPLLRGILGARQELVFGELRRGSRVPNTSLDQQYFDQTHAEYGPR